MKQLLLYYCKLLFNKFIHALSKRSRDGVVVRALTSHQWVTGSIWAQCHMWVEFVVGSRLAPRAQFSSGTPVFLSPEKPTFPNSKLIRTGPV